MATVGGAQASSGQFDHLSGGRLDVNKIRQLATYRIEKCLSGLNGSKLLIWDSSVLSKMNLVMEPQFLRDHGVAKMNQLPQVDLRCEVDYFVYFVSPTKQVVEQVAESVRSLHAANRSKVKVALFFIPRQQKMVDLFLTKPELSGMFHLIGDMDFYLYPLENDLMTLSMNSAFTDLYVDKDPSPLYNVARSLMDIQSVFGPLPQILGKGHNATRVVQIMDQLKEQLYPGGRIPSDSIPQISSVILVDRSVDFMTPLFTQLTLEGLIDSIYAIENNMAVFPSDTFSDEVKKAQGNLYSEQKKECKIKLCAKDDLYTHIRDLHIQAIGPYIKKELAELADYFHMNPRAMSIAEMKDYAQDLPQKMQGKLQLSKYSTIGVLVRQFTQEEAFLDLVFAEQDLREGDYGDKPLPYIEACIVKRDSINKVLRLICIHSLAQHGLKPKLLEHYEKEILQAYGYEYLLALTTLRKAGLLTIQEGRSVPQVKKQFRLFTETKDQNPADISYVYSGYAPLSVRIVEVLTRPEGVRDFAESLRHLPGPTVEHYPTVPQELVKNRTAGNDKPVVLVYFIGGCTFAEIAALRFMASRREDAEYDYVIATTHICNGRDLMKSFLCNVPRNEHAQKTSPRGASGSAKAKPKK